MAGAETESKTSNSLVTYILTGLGAAVLLSLAIWPRILGKHVSWDHPGALYVGIFILTVTLIGYSAAWFSSWRGRNGVLILISLLVLCWTTLFEGIILLISDAPNRVPPPSFQETMTISYLFFSYLAILVIAILNLRLVLRPARQAVGWKKVTAIYIMHVLLSFLLFSS